MVNSILIKNETMDLNLRSKVFEAVASKSIQKTQQIVNSLLNINQKDIDGNSFLHFACLNPTFEILEYLINHGADVNQINNNYQTPIMMLLFSKSAEFMIPCIQLLLNHHANVSLRDRANMDAFEQAIFYKAPITVLKMIFPYLDKKNLLVDENDHRTLTSNHWIAEQDIDFFKELLGQIDHSAKDEIGNTLLIREILNPHPLVLEIVIFLLSHGANPLIRGFEGATALELAKDFFMNAQNILAPHQGDMSFLNENEGTIKIIKEHLMEIINLLNLYRIMHLNQLVCREIVSFYPSASVEELNLYKPDPEFCLNKIKLLIENTNPAWELLNKFLDYLHPDHCGITIPNCLAVFKHLKILINGYEKSLEENTPEFFKLLKIIENFVSAKFHLTINHSESHILTHIHLIEEALLKKINENQEIKTTSTF